MFDDPKNDLKRMEEELLAQEDISWLEQELEEARRLIGDAAEEETPQEQPAVTGARAANTDRLDVDLDAYSDGLLDAPPAKREKGVRALVALIVLELLGIAAIGVYWLAQLL